MIDILIVLALITLGSTGSSEIPDGSDILRASQLELEPHVPEPAPAPAPAPEVDPGPLSELAAATGLSEERVAAFLALADCETGLWIDGGASFVEASAVWTSTAGLYEGGLQFHPGTWDAYRDAGHPDNAAQASRVQQIVVADRVRAAQGFNAWPTCARKIGLIP